MNAELLWLAFQAEGFSSVTLEACAAEMRAARACLTPSAPPYLWIYSGGVIVQTRKGAAPGNDFINCYQDGRFLLTHAVLERIAKRLAWRFPSCTP
jgi:hypothetical protein